jgi:hypothetical protein
MTLGQRLNRQQLEALSSLFGLHALTISKTDTVKVSFDRFFKDMEPAEKETWIDGMHACLGLPRYDAAQEKISARLERERTLERLRLAFPELIAVHQMLAEQTADSWLTSSRQKSQDLYFKAAELTDYLRNNRKIITFSELGARFCNNSKALRNTELSRLTASWLLTLEDAEGKWPENVKTVWDRCHVVRDRLSVQTTIFGPLIYEKENRRFDWIYQLWRNGEPATLSWPNISGIDRIFIAENHDQHNRLITCENETPFARMIRESQPGIILYTCGFPNDAVLSLYRQIAPQTLSNLHWGDSDLAGLRIAGMLHACYPLQLWRCDLETLFNHQDNMIALSVEQKKQLEQFIRNHPDFPFAKELHFTLQQGWLEQESWQRKIS